MPQPEVSGSGPGNTIRTAVGHFDDDSYIDPTILKRDPPVWFTLFQGATRKHYYKCLNKVPTERAIKILQAAGLPPLCVLAVAMRWELLIKDGFDYVDLQTVFDEAGHDVSTFGKTLDQLEIRCLYRLYRRYGLSDASMMLNADISEFGSSS
jgi:hypothetical protein